MTKLAGHLSKIQSLSITISILYSLLICIYVLHTEKDLNTANL